MAKRRGARGAKSRGSARKRAGSPRSGKRPSRKASARRKPAPRATAPRRRARAAASRPPKSRAKPARLERVRRTLDDTVPTPPSSLNMDRHASAARTGRAEMAESRLEHKGMSPDITAGDVDVDVEDAYFTGEEAPGGDNPTPDQDVVDDIGKALGVQYQDAEELKSSDKVVERDKHRWELDPASSEDYKERK